ncbi:MAG TPA: RNA 3'-terminal phosphate cyclase [Candidatus Nanoarchaeia archaeon]|nr:RNA 3'-terminal phosphate cyclase [Candidatus Nanoarchaeia archaeon]
MIQLDGRYGEGGGALVRTALALSTLTGKSFEVKDIRAGRPNPGLKAQHLTAINALKEITGAETNKIFLGSTGLSFIPGRVKRGIYNIDIGTAGSITLLLQALILPCLFAPGKITLTIKGGTCGKWQASVDYLQNILLPQLNRFVEKIELKIIKRGYYPKGSGEVKLEICPRRSGNLEEIGSKYAEINLTKQGKLEQIKGIINLSTELQEKEVASRIKIAAESALKRYNAPINFRIEQTASLSPGGEVLLYALFSSNHQIDPDNPVILASDALIEKGKRSEEIGQEAAERLVKEISSNAAADHYLADQLIQFMALLPGSKISTSSVSNHALTNIYVAEKFLAVQFKVSNNLIAVSGIE